MAALLFTVLWQIRFPARQTFYDDALSLENVLPVRGLCALVIMLHHFSASFTSPYLLGAFTHVGYLLVALFFFFSGYGLMRNYLADSAYLRLQSFVPKRIVKTILPYWISLLLVSVLRILCFPPFSLHDMLIAFVWPTETLKNSWYVFEALLLYLAFMLFFKIRNRKIAMGGMLLFILALILFFDSKYDVIWARSLPGFAIGLLYGMFQEQLFAFWKKRYYLKLFGLAVLFAVCSGLRYWFFVEHHVVAQYVFDAFSAAVFTVLCVVLLMKVRISNPILRFVGSISYEFYLLHGAIILFLIDAMKDNMLLFFLAVLAFTLAASVLVNRVNVYAQKRLLPKQKR